MKNQAFFEVLPQHYKLRSLPLQNFRSFYAPGYYNTNSEAYISNAIGAFEKITSKQSACVTLLTWNKPFTFSKKGIAFRHCNKKDKPAKISHGWKGHSLLLTKLMAGVAHTPCAQLVIVWQERCYLNLFFIF